MLMLALSNFRVFEVERQEIKMFLLLELLLEIFFSAIGADAHGHGELSDLFSAGSTASLLVPMSPETATVHSPSAGGASNAVWSTPTPWRKTRCPPR